MLEAIGQCRIGYAAGLAQVFIPSMVAKFDAYLKAHPNATAPLRQSVSAQLRIKPRKERCVRGEPAGYELSEEPRALRLVCLPLCEKPERSVHVQVGARHSHQ